MKIWFIIRTIFFFRRVVQPVSRLLDKHQNSESVLHFESIYLTEWIAKTRNKSNWNFFGRALFDLFGVREQRRLPRRGCYYRSKEKELLHFIISSTVISSPNPNSTFVSIFSSFLFYPLIDTLLILSKSIFCNLIDVRLSIEWILLQFQSNRSIDWIVEYKIEKNIVFDSSIFKFIKKQSWLVKDFLFLQLQEIFLAKLIYSFILFINKYNCI